jgi:transcriptional regulator with XRE-family HTH domain
MSQADRGPKFSVRFQPNAIKRLREKKEWTQEELASNAGISIDGCRRAERGNPVTVDTARSIGVAFEIDYRTICASTSSVRFGKFVVQEDEVHEMVFFVLSLTRTALTIVERLLKNSAPPKG